jgi:hypothetical protein
MKSIIYNLFKILLSEYLREYVAKNLKKPVFPTPFSLSFSLSGFFGAPSPIDWIWLPTYPIAISP